MFQILDPSGDQNGHVPRNVRLSLAAIDMVQPYICLGHVGLTGVSQTGAARKLAVNNGHSANASEHQQSHQNRSSHLETKSNPRVEVKIPTADLEIEWYVGGAQRVDCTFLAWHLAPAPPLPKNAHSNWSKYLASLDSAATRDAFDTACLRAETKSSDNNLRRESAHVPTGESFPVVASRSFNGTARWTKSASESSFVGQQSDADNLTKLGNKIAFEADDPIRPLTSYRSSAAPRHARSEKVFAPGRYWLVAWSLVDQHYGAVGQGYPAETAPQSHLSNVRTNPSWRKTAGHRIIQGRLYWPSDPVEVVVHANGSYHVASAVTHCAWWDRQLVAEHDVHTHRTPSGDNALSADPTSVPTAAWFDYSNSTVAQDLIKNIFDRTTYAPAGQQSGIDGAYKMFGVTLGLLLITIVCCVVLYYQYRRSSIYAQVANNKYVNLSTIKHFRGRVTTHSALTPTKV